MECEERKISKDRSVLLPALLSRISKVQEELRNIEELRSKKLQPEDRLFSFSSVTSPAAEELVVGRDDGRSNLGPGGSTGAEMYANRQGKPKRGRPASREARRARHTSEQNFDHDDDPDLTS